LGPQPATRYAYLLDADDDLGRELEPTLRGLARRATAVPVLDTPAGSFDLRAWLSAVGRGPGLLILDGLISLEVTVGDRVALDLVGVGDLLQPSSPRPDELVSRRGSSRALWPTRLAVLDETFAERVQAWPALGVALLRRAGRRIADADALRAIAGQPRLELRLVLVLWNLATRWGRVEPGGIRLKLPLTHRLLGQLVAAERPSISHALHRLSECGLVTGQTSDLHLHGTLDEQLEMLVGRSGAARGRSDAGQVLPFVRPG
jgi:CRP-like cAMP-binding protein